MLAHRHGAWTATIAVLAFLHAITFLGAGPIDDDFIAFRYARNLANGDGLTFTPGEAPVEGFSSPLWVLLLAGASKAGISLEWASQSLCAAGLAVAAAASGLLWFRKSTERTLPVPAICVALSPAMAYHAAAGLGTTLLAGLLATSAYVGESSRDSRGRALSAGLLGLACILRQEALLFASPVLLLHLGAKRWTPALLVVLPTAAWMTFRLYYFGTLLPQTYWTKSLPLADELSYGVEYLWRSSLTAGVGPALALGALSLRASSAYMRATWAGVLLYSLGVVGVGGDFMPLARFFVPVLPLLYVAALEGGLAMTAGHRRLRAWSLAAVLLLLALPQQQRPDLEGEQTFFVERWARLGSYFREVVPPDSRVALSPIGAFGFRSNLPVIDLLGLTNTGTRGVPPDLSIHMKGHHRYNADWVLQQEPDFVILANGVRMPGSGTLFINPWERSLYLHPRFAELYVHTIAPIPDDSALDVWVRRGVRGLPEARAHASK